MSKTARTPEGTAVRWGISDFDWGKYNEGEPVERHAWKQLDRTKAQWETICGSTLIQGGEIINRTNIAKCPDCEKLMTPVPITVVSSHVSDPLTMPGTTVYNVALMLSDKTMHQQFVVIWRERPATEWTGAPNDPYPHLNYKCTCGGQQVYSDRTASCEHIRQVIARRGEDATATLREN